MASLCCLLLSRAAILLDMPLLCFRRFSDITLVSPRRFAFRAAMRRFIFVHDAEPFAADFSIFMSADYAAITLSLRVARSSVITRKQRMILPRACCAIMLMRCAMILL